MLVAEFNLTKKHIELFLQLLGTPSYSGNGNFSKLVLLNLDMSLFGVTVKK